MAHSPDTLLGRNIVVRWRMLAERRLDHLIELYQTGRWKRYHGEVEFLEMVQEARSALKVWQQLAPPDPINDKPVEVSLDQVFIGLEDVPPRSFAVLADSVGADHDLGKS
jgi:uncharacterized repeat protein (TIGR03809 family)